ncbi:uncharacterized protein [Macrobrachium rosenbergii]|uniref:uncharacterized protein n=1 Tax=Macrobrachium rosenbergii TaxID=79674 RepID=UPI0034D5E8DC
MRKLSLRCSPTPHTVSGVGPPPTPPPSQGLSPTPTPPTTPARRLVSSRSLGSTSSPPLTPPVTQYNIPACLPSHQHHAQLPPTPGPPSHRSLPALHAHHIQNDSHPHYSSHPTLHPHHHHHHPPPLSPSPIPVPVPIPVPIPGLMTNPEVMPPHSPHSPLIGPSPHSSPPANNVRPPGSHFSHAAALSGHQHPRQLPGLPRHHTFGGVGSGRILPPAPHVDPSCPAAAAVATASAVAAAAAAAASSTTSNTSPLPPPINTSMSSSLAARPAHALQSPNYKYSLDVPRVNLRDLRSNTYPPPGTEGSSTSQSSSTTSGGTVVPRTLLILPLPLLQGFLRGV